MRRALGRNSSRTSASRSCATAPLTQALRADDAASLWGATPRPVDTTASVAAGVKVFARCAMDPLTSLPTPTARIITEDVMGTDVTSTDPSLAEQSVAFWRRHHTDAVTVALRQERRSGEQYVGVTRDGPVPHDEADRADTTWAQDKQFTAVLKALQAAVPTLAPANLEQMEALLRQATPEQFAALVAAPPPPYAEAGLDVPLSAAGHYEGDRLAEWATKYQTARLAANEFLSKMSATEWAKVAKAMATCHAAITEKRVARQARQEATGVRKAWGAMTEEEKRAAALSEVEMLAAGIAEAEVDPEDKADQSEEWLLEQEAIAGLAAAELEGLGVSYKDVWTHTLRLEGLEFEHLWAVDAHKALQAAAVHRLVDDAGTSIVAIHGAWTAAWAGSTLDAGSLAVRLDVASPEVSKLMWVKYGAGTMAARSPGGVGRLRVSHFSNLEEVRAQYILHQQLRPLSSALEYSTPHQFRKAYAAIAADFLVASAAAAARPTMDVLRGMSAAEDALMEVRWAAEQPAGVARRARHAASRARWAKEDFPLSSATITAPADDVAQAATAVGLPAAAWPMGAVRTVALEWPTPLADTAPAPSKAHLTTPAATIELSLWRKRADPKAAVAARVERLGKVASAVKDCPTLAAAHTHVAASLQRCAAVDAAVGAKLSAAEVAAEEEWEFVAMIDDACPLNNERTCEVVLPFLAGPPHSTKGFALPDGQYRLRARAFDRGLNPSATPDRCGEAFTAPFEAVNPLPALRTHLFGGADAEVFPGSKLMPAAASMRAMGLKVPTAMEIELGQVLTPKGEVVVAHVEAVITGGQHVERGARVGISDLWLRAEAGVRRYWELRNPGATEAEWASARRSVLVEAFSDPRRDWWIADPLLEDDSVALTEVDATLRHGVNAVAVASTTGTTNASGEHTAPVAAVQMAGDGTVLAVDVSPAAAKQQRMTVGAALDAVMTAANDAHADLCALSAVKLNAVEREAMVSGLGSSNMTDMGGRFGRTYNACFADARRLVDGEAGTADLSIREKPVDRYASETPELRRRLFNRAPNPSDHGPEDFTPPEHQSEWK